MSADALQLATAATPQSVAPPPAARDAVQASKAAEDFEAVFINEFLGSMFDGISTDGPFGGGPGEGMFRSMMMNEYSKSIARQGGFGLADAVQRELTMMQAQGR